MQKVFRERWDFLGRWNTWRNYTVSKAAVESETGIYFFNRSVHCWPDHVLRVAYRVKSSMHASMSEPSDAPYRNSVIIMPENVSPFDDSSLLRSWQHVYGWEKLKPSQPSERENDTHLTLVSIDNHCHPFHINALFDNTFQACLQLRVESVNMLRRHGSYIDRQVT